MRSLIKFYRLILPYQCSFHLLDVFESINAHFQIIGRTVFMREKIRDWCLWFFLQIYTRKAHYNCVTTLIKHVCLNVCLRGALNLINDEIHMA